MKSIITTALFLFLFTSILSSQENRRTHDITIDDYFSQDFIDKMSASPDGELVVFNKLTWDKSIDGRNSELYVVDLSSKEIAQLTNSLSSETNPTWSNDNDYIYFIGRYNKGEKNSPGKDGTKQVWRIEPDGDDLTQITEVNGGIDSYQLSADGKFVYYTIHKDHMINEWKELRKEFEDDLKYGHGIHKKSELWQLEIDSEESKVVYNKIRYVRYFDLSPDGIHAALITDPDEKLITHEGESRVEILNVQTGDVIPLEDKLWREEAPTPYGWLSNPKWSPAGNRLAFQISFDGYPSELFVQSFMEENSTLIKLKREGKYSVMGDLNWKSNSNELFFLADIEGRKHIYNIDVTNGRNLQLTNGDLVIDDFQFADEGRIITTQSSLTYARDIVVHSNNSKERITNINPQIDSWKLPQTSIFKWAGANGDTVEGILELPPNYNGEKNLPLIVQIHGGPTASSKFSFKYWIYGRTAFATKGYVVLSPNYRGSTGYGDKFLTELIGRENDIDVKDIITGVDALIDKGIVDPERLGVMGWSNGGYLTNCLIATNRFKAASSGAGVISQTMQWGEEDTPGHVINYMDALPWENPEEYIKASPLFSYSKKITTATIIHVGEDDARVPVTHSQTLHRALKHYIKAPTELLIYPGEPHSLTTYKHRLAKVMWDHAWFDKYLPVDKLKVKKNLEESRKK